MLAKENCSIEKVASSVGYPVLSTFMRNFKKITGTSPNAWRRKSLENPENVATYQVTVLKGWKNTWMIWYSCPKRNKCGEAEKHILLNKFYLSYLLPPVLFLILHTFIITCFIYIICNYSKGSIRLAYFLPKSRDIQGKIPSPKVIGIYFFRHFSIFLDVLTPKKAPTSPSVPLALIIFLSINSASPDISSPLQTHHSVHKICLCFFCILHMFLQNQTIPRLLLLLSAKPAY